MVRWLPLGLEEALELTMAQINPLTPQEIVDLSHSVDRVIYEDMFSSVNSPSVDASLKDGYAVMSKDIAAATTQIPVELKLIGSLAAGGRENLTIVSGTAARILTGAKIPEGADAVVSEEFVHASNHAIRVTIFAEPGRNILPRGCDVKEGECIARKGQRLTPGLVGLLAASGHHQIPVAPNPRVAIIATGDEVVAPGKPLTDGKLYASNMVTLAAWCRRYGMATRLAIVKDHAGAIEEVLSQMAAETDAIITSGGAWTGDRDMVAHILDKLSWRCIFHRIRIGPGKAVGFGMLDGKPVFILPGGPPSNLMGFLQIALPGLLKLAGHLAPALPTIPVKLADELTGAYEDWTQLIFGDLEMQTGLPLFHALRSNSRLGAMAQAKAVVAIGEGKTRLPAGAIVFAQLLE